MAFAKPTQTFDFPPSIRGVSEGQHYMLIESYESKNATTIKGRTLSSIALYIPTGSLNTSFTGTYEGVTGATNTLDKTNVFVGDNSLMNRLETFAASTFKSGLGVLAAGGGQTLAAQGVIPNNYLALVYQGPTQFREHTFAFKFFPKNEEESERVNDIITEFKQGTLPRLSGGGQEQLKDAFFKSPRHHKIKFLMGGTLQDDNTFLFKIGTSVITSMIVNYDPQGTVGFHDNGAPVSVDLSLTFKEITLPISTDAITKTRRDTVTSIAGQQAQAQAANDVVPAENITGVGGIEDRISRGTI